MSMVLPNETRDQLVKRMAIECAELGRAIRAGEYDRAASIASYIAIQLRGRAMLVKDSKP